MMPEADAVVDTSFAIALLNTRDAYHQKAVDTYARYKRLLLPQPALTELAFLLERRSVNLAFVAFLERLGASYFEVVELSAADLARVAEVLRQYADTRIDFVGSEEHTSELQSLTNLVCRLLLEKKKHPPPPPPHPHPPTPPPHPPHPASTTISFSTTT